MPPSGLAGAVHSERATLLFFQVFPFGVFWLYLLLPILFVHDQALSSHETLGKTLKKALVVNPVNGITSQPFSVKKSPDSGPG